MPGLSFIFDSKEDLRNDNSVILKALDTAIHDKRYKKHILLNEKSFFLGSTLYDEYPITSYENDNFIIYLEGMIYNRQSGALNEELNTLAQIISLSDINAKENVAKWLLCIDGDFLLFIINKKTNTIYMLNDALGRLPVYVYSDNSKLIVSRELRFILHLISNVSFDKMAIAQTLAFGVIIGTRTLMENVHRLEPFSLIEIKDNTSEIKRSILHQFNYEEKNHSDKSLQHNVDQLVSLFSETCSNMASVCKYFKNVLALSGGLDSRAVAAALWKTECQFLGVTRLSFDKREIAEIDIAKQVANIFSMEWKVIVSKPPKGKDLLTLLRTKNGMNSLNVGLFIPYLQNVWDQYGSRVMFFTGDDGNHRLPDCRPNNKLKDMNDLIHYFLIEQQRMPMDKVVELTKIKKKEIIDELECRFLSYPEKDVNQKYIHFLNHDKASSRCFESEDRNRHYFWSVSPYNSMRFYDYAMNCPDIQKENRILHREFLMKLSPQAAGIINKDWGCSILSKEEVLKTSFKSFRSKIPCGVKNTIRKYISRYQYNPNSIVVNCLFDQLNNCHEINAYISREIVKASIRDLTRVQVNYLFTITSIIEDITNSKSMLDKYAQYDFT